MHGRGPRHRWPRQHFRRLRRAGQPGKIAPFAVMRKPVMFDPLCSKLRRREDHPAASTHGPRVMQEFKSATLNSFLELVDFAGDAP